MTPIRTRLATRAAAVCGAALLVTACAGADEMEADVDDPADDLDTEEPEEDEPEDDDAAEPEDDAAEDDAVEDDEADDAEAADGLLGELQEAGSATIGIANEVPYGFEDEDGNVTGQAPEIAYEVLGELGIDDVDAEIVEFGALIPGLQAGQFDLIAAGMFITPERAEQVIFADPDYCVTYGLAVEEGNPLGLSDFQSVVDEGATIAVLSGAVDEDYVEGAGIPSDQVELFGDVNDQYEALAAGRVDAVGGTFLTVTEQTEADDSIEATESFFPTDEDGNEIPGCGAFGFDDQEFRDAFNDVLDELKEESTVVEITSGFDFPEEDITRAFDYTVDSLVEEMEAAEE
jgi:polar amino acid transport system substrate-binding protein